MRRALATSALVISALWLGCNAIVGLDPGTPFCSDSLGCDDSNACTLDACSMELTCVSTPVPDGKSPEQIPGNCQTEMCQGGLPTAMDNDSDIPDDGEPCTKDLCVNGVPTHTPMADGMACMKAGVSGVCASGACGCRTDADCPDTNPCTTDVCDPVAHICDHWPLDNVPVPGMPETPADCLAHRCVAGVSIDVVDDTDAPAAPDECTLLGCNSGKSESAPAAAGASCGGGNGVCDGAMHCVQCIEASDCAALADQPCRKRTCSKNMCGYLTFGFGTIPADVFQPTGDCKLLACDGLGNLVTSTNTQDADDANPCTIDTCSGQNQVHSPVAAGASCGGTLQCDGAKSCGGCIADADCPQDFCRVGACVATKCVYTLTPAQTPLPTQMANDCQVLVCDGMGHTVSLADDTDFAPGGCQGCLFGVSSPRVDQPCMAMGQSGYCTALEQCVECTRDAQCPDPGPCKVAVCDVVTHKCGSAMVTAGKRAAVASQVAGDCSVLTCDGKGNATPTALDADVPAPKGPCTSGTCAGGTPAFINLPKGTPCGAKACDGLGSCL